MDSSGGWLVESHPQKRAFMMIVSAEIAYVKLRKASNALGSRDVWIAQARSFY